MSYDENTRTSSYQWAEVAGYTYVLIRNNQRSRHVTLSAICNIHESETEKSGCIGTPVSDTECESNEPTCPPPHNAHMLQVDRTRRIVGHSKDTQHVCSAVPQDCAKAMTFKPQLQYKM